MVKGRSPENPGSLNPKTRRIVTDKKMARTKIIYRSKEEILGKHLRSGEWIYYIGDLTIYDRKTSPIVLKLKSEIIDTFIGEFMEERKEFKGKSLSEVFGKVSKWLINRGAIFQN